VLDEFFYKLKEGWLWDSSYLPDQDVNYVRDQRSKTWGEFFITNDGVHGVDGSQRNNFLFILKSHRLK
jgi:hypothetical protein